MEEFKMIRTDLLKKVKDITASGLPFMEGKEKSALVEGALYKITNVGYLISDENKEFVVLADEDNFYFGGSVEPAQGMGALRSCPR
jgi:hypothetical protein